jgi:hypothetical protein
MRNTPSLKVLEREHLLYQRTCDVQKNSPEFESKKENRPRRACSYKLKRIKQMLFLS